MSFDITKGLFEDISLGTNIFTDELDNANEKADQLKEKFMEIGQGIEDGIVSGLTDAVMGTKSLAEAATGVLNRLKQQLVEVAIQRSVSGIGNFFGNALGNIFGGKKKPKAAPFITDTFLGGAGSKFLGLGGLFANGGRPPVGKASIVGERGPELFVPKVAGTIIPNNKLGGGDNTTNIVNVSVDASGSSVAGNSADAQQLGAVIGAAVQAQLIKEKRSGGLLAR